VETRVAVYPVRGEVHQYKYDGRWKYADDPGGIGVETVREVIVCEACAARAPAQAKARPPPAMA
jgi:hypothetical protein